MIYEIIYANRERGYDLYDQSPGFPAGYLSQVRTVCGRLCGQTASDYHAEHYACLPLDQNTCLLAVIVRQPEGNAGEKRAHSMVLAFLADREDTSILLGSPAKLFAAMKKAAKKHLSFEGSPLDLYETPLSFLEEAGSALPASRVPSESLQQALAMAVLYAGGEKAGQVMISLQEAAAGPECLIWLLPMVPSDIRSALSFHTGIRSAQEGVGCILKFCSDRDYQLMQRTGFDGGERTVLSHWSGGKFTCNDPAAREKAGLLLPCLSQDSGRRTWPALQRQAGIAEEEKTTVRQRGNESMNKQAKADRPSTGAAVLSILIEAALCIGLLAALYLGLKYMISLTLSQSGSYVIVSAAAVSQTALCIVCLTAGFLLGLLVSHLIATLKKLRS